MTVTTQAKFAQFLPDINPPSINFMALVVAAIRHLMDPNFVDY